MGREREHKRRRGKKGKRGDITKREWILQKKERRRKQGKDVQSNSKYTVRPSALEDLLTKRPWEKSFPLTQRRVRGKRRGGSESRDSSDVQNEMPLCYGLVVPKLEMRGLQTSGLHLRITLR